MHPTRILIVHRLKRIAYASFNTTQATLRECSTVSTMDGVSHSPSLNNRPLFPSKRHKHIGGSITAGYFSTIPKPHQDSTVAKELTDAFLLLPDKPFSGGHLTRKAPVLVDKATNQPITNLDTLRRLGSPAVCGRGMETVLDMTVRNTLCIEPEEIAVHWKDCCGGGVTAEHPALGLHEALTQLRSTKAHR